ncbi:uncharacterized protein TRIADDRAFT_57575 [Trichoplax adhaerens]|uniref:G-protein coupled receptors family 1 profile domain-containing protein n=1 Tax=Trichoplax adhaerens TaxID=10228 RepID=B3RZT9_TRIAD|nr:predicted protein [Trichoplax adhaerens]EDV24264.1 predicted protein [Trichoplax adhaerens]|eukprot:XP_002113790.1 predicted protein [Trichoplax adhaerens]
MMSIFLNKPTSPYNSTSYFCKVLYCLATYTDLVKLVTIAVLCYCAVHNRRYDKEHLGDRFQTISIIILVILWIYPILTVILPISANWGTVVYSQTSGLCVLSVSSDHPVQLITFLLYASIFGIGIPMSITLVYSVKMLFFIRKKPTKRITFGHSLEDNKFHRADTQLGKVTLRVAVMDFGLNVPWAIVQSVRVFGVDIRVTILYYLLIFISCLGSVFNPFLFYRKETRDKRQSRCSSPERSKILYTATNRTRIN